MGASDTNKSLFGKSNIDPEAASKGFQLGAQAGQLAAQTGPAAFINQAIQSAQQQREIQAKLKQEELKSKVAQLQGLILKDPEHPIAKKVLSDPNMAQLVGIDPSKSKGVGGENVLAALLGGGSGNMSGLPVGTNINVKTGFGSVNIPANTRLTDEERNQISGGQDVKTSVQKLVGMLDEGVLRNKEGKSSLISQLKADMGSQVLIKDQSPLESFTSEINNLKARIPFAKGGKQLTPFEANILFRLLDTRGKSDEVIKTDLNRFVTEFDRLSQLTEGGRSAISNLDAVNEAKKVGGVIMEDASGNRAMVYPDGSFEEID